MAYSTQPTNSFLIVGSPPVKTTPWLVEEFFFKIFLTSLSVLLGLASRLFPWTQKRQRLLHWKPIFKSIEKIDFDRREFGITGKGGRARVVFLSSRSCEYLKKYLNERKDHFKPLFIK